MPPGDGDQNVEQTGGENDGQVGATMKVDEHFALAACDRGGHIDKVVEDPSSPSCSRGGLLVFVRIVTLANPLRFSSPPPPPGDVLRLAPNVISVRHWDRLLGGLLYAAEPRVDWATLLRRSLSVDALQCPKCHGRLRGRLRVVGVITEQEPIRRILAHLGQPTDPPPVARARDPTDDVDGQLALGFA